MDSLYWKWKLVYVHGLSVREQVNQRPGHFGRWSDDDTQRLIRKSENSEWMTKTHESGYYLINYDTLENGGNDYRERQDKLLSELGTDYGRVPINILSETGLSLHYALGEKHSEFGHALHWTDQMAANGNFLSLEINVDGRINEKTLHLILSDAPVGKSWAGDAFVGRHGMCIYLRHEPMTLC